MKPCRLFCWGCNMRKINFTKMVASGNGFVVIQGRKGTRTQGHRLLARRLCDRKYGIGADGLLVLEKSKVADVKMRIFNADGSEAEMCGNGARCVAFWLADARGKTHNAQPAIETQAGIIKAKTKGEQVKIKLTDPKDIKLDLPITVGGRCLKVNFIDTGVPHAVVFVEGLETIDVCSLGRMIRYHKKFSPRGANVNFVEVRNYNSIRVRTYERGVEDETLACGTGSVASALIFVRHWLRCLKGRIKVVTKSGEILSVYFDRRSGDLTDVWLEGSSSIVFEGIYKA